MVKYNNSAVLSFLILYIIVTLFSLLQTLTQEYYPGELYRFVRTISDLETIILTFFTILSFIICFVIYKSFQMYRVRINNNVRFIFDEKKTNQVMFFILLAQLLFLIYTGIGKVTVNSESLNTSKYSVVFSFFKPEPFIFLYYLVFRAKNGFKFSHEKFFAINIVLFSVLKLLQGWTSFILLLFFLEIHIRFQKNKVNLFYVIGVPLFIIVIGGAIYQHAYVLKNEIRGVNTSQISYIEGVEKLASRLSMNPNSLGAYQNYSKIVLLYKSENNPLKESKALLRPILPGGLIDKSFRNLNNNVMTSYTPDLNQFTSSDFGIVMYYAILFNASIFDFILSVILTISLIFIAKLYFDSLANVSGQFDILLFFVIFYTFYTVSLENVFGQNFIPYIFSALVYFLLGAIKLVYNKES